MQAHDPIDLRSTRQLRAAYEEFLSEPSARRSFFRASLLTKARSHRRLAAMLTLCCFSYFARAAEAAVHPSRHGPAYEAMGLVSFTLAVVSGFCAFECNQKAKWLQHEASDL